MKNSAFYLEIVINNEKSRKLLRLFRGGFGFLK